MTTDPQFAALQKGIDKLIAFVDTDLEEEVFTMSEYSEMYTFCYDLCYKEFTQEVCNLFKKNVERICQKWNKDLSITKFIEIDKKFSIFKKWITKIFLYVLRIVNEDLEGYPDLIFYKNVILGNKQIVEIAFEDNFNNVNQDLVNNYLSLIKKNNNVDLSVDLYPKWLELLENKLSKWIEKQFETSPIESIFERFLDKYKNIILPDEYLKNSTERMWKKICILNNCDKFLAYAEEKKSIDFMCSFYKIIKDNIDSLKELSIIYGKSIVIKQNNIIELCQSHKYFSEEIKNLFENSNFFVSKLNNKFDLVINNAEKTWIENIVIHIDKCITNNETEYFDTLISLIELIKDKDIVEILYRKKMSSRLVKKPNLDTEKDFLRKLKKKLGYQYISKYETMIKDILNPINIMADTKFTANILQQGAWPFEKRYELEVPGNSTITR